MNQNSREAWIREAEMQDLDGQGIREADRRKGGVEERERA